MNAGSKVRICKGTKPAACRRRRYHTAWQRPGIDLPPARMICRISSTQPEKPVLSALGDFQSGHIPLYDYLVPFNQELVWRSAW